MGKIHRCLADAQYLGSQGRKRFVQLRLVEIERSMKLISIKLSI